MCHYHFRVLRHILDQSLAIVKYIRTVWHEKESWERKSVKFNGALVKKLRLPWILSLNSNEVHYIFHLIHLEHLSQWHVYAWIKSGKPLKDITNSNSNWVAIAHKWYYIFVSDPQTLKKNWKRYWHGINYSLCKFQISISEKALREHDIMLWNVYDWFIR